ncbi:hypothetical protein VTG60DRAFT_6001 [Thermothelomyces hinnuleus]
MANFVAARLQTNAIRNLPATNRGRWSLHEVVQIHLLSFTKAGSLSSSTLVSDLLPPGPVHFNFPDPAADPDPQGQPSTHLILVVSTRVSISAPRYYKSTASPPSLRPALSQSPSPRALRPTAPRPTLLSSLLLASFLLLFQATRIRSDLHLPVVAGQPFHLEQNNCIAIAILLQASSLGGASLLRRIVEIASSRQACPNHFRTRSTNLSLQVARSAVTPVHSRPHTLKNRGTQA